jgi:RNA polymerase sigma factor (sigma-70 family)
VDLPPFQALLDANASVVHRFLIATVGPSDADDVYQETWIAALRAYPALNHGSNLRGWLLTVAHRKAIDHIRARGRRATPVADLPDIPSEDRLPSGDGIWQHVRRLPEKQRAAVAMRYLVDAGYSEIAAALDCSEDAARRSVHEGLKRLRLEYAR